MKILIMDDEPKIRNGLSNLLTRREGMEVAGAYENAADALEISRGESGGCDDHGYQNAGDQRAGTDRAYPGTG